VAAPCAAPLLWQQLLVASWPIHKGKCVFSWPRIYPALVCSYLSLERASGVCSSLRCLRDRWASTTR